MVKFENQQEEEDEIDDLFYEAKNDDEFAKIRRQTKRGLSAEQIEEEKQEKEVKPALFGKFNKK